MGVKPLTRRDLQPLLAHHFPLCAPVDLPENPSTQELSVAFQSAVPKFCITEIDHSPDRVFSLIPELLRMDAKLGILVVLPNNQPDLILRCLRLGATEFLIAPFTEDQVQSAAQKLVKLLPRPEASVAAKVFCVMPAKGSCGSTTVACNVAFELKRLGSSRVLLADMDPLTGTVSFLLKIKSLFSFVDVLNRAADMDADLWKAMVTNCHGVDVLLAPETLVEGASDIRDASPIIDHARYNYDTVVLDAGAAIGDWSVSQAELSDEVLLVATNELSSLHAAQRSLNYLESNGIERWKIKLLINRYDQHVGLSKEAIANALNADVYHVLPSDHASIQKSMLEGKAVLPACSFGKSVTALAEKLAGREEHAKKSSSFAGLLSLFSRTSSKGPETAG